MQFRGSWYVIAFLASLALLSLSTPVLAQSQEFDANAFNPPMDNYGLLTMHSSQMYPQYRLGAGLYLHYMNQPLVMTQLAGDRTSRETKELIGDRLKMDLTFAMAFCDYYEAGFDLPVLLYQNGDGFEADRGISTSAFGDFRLHQKFRALDREKWPVGLALVTTLVFPSGDEGSYFGNHGVGAEFVLVVDGQVGPVLLAANVGYRIRDEVKVYEIITPNGGSKFSQQIDDELLFAIGAQYFTPIENLSALLEFRGSTLAEEPFNQRFNNPLFLDLGARYLVEQYGISVSAAVEVGLNSGYGVGPAGFFVNLGWNWDKPDQDKDGSIDEVDQCIDQPEDVDGFKDEDGCPDPDNDEDGLLDAVDQCPDEAEDKDDYRDSDGCPDTDNDMDGIPDIQDQCPMAAEDKDGDRDKDGCPDLDTDEDGIEDIQDQCMLQAEDKDGFEDEDGCPDPDNDKDGILDTSDQCPNEVEDKDFFQDEDGCPEPDNDRDGVLDADDRCPVQPETINGNEDADGCPDEGEVVVIDKGDRLELKAKVEFEPAAALLKRSSFSLLDQIVQTIKAHGSYGLLIVESHTDAGVSEKIQKELSLARAQMVKAYLVNHGLAEGTVKAVGIGSEQPIASNRTRKGREENNRVEFKILSKDAISGN